MARFGKTDQLRSKMFESSNRIRFVVEVGKEDVEWWLTSIYDPFELTPEDVGDRLSASWAGDKRMEVSELNGKLQRFAVQLRANLGADRSGCLKERSISKVLS